MNRQLTLPKLIKGIITGYVFGSINRRVEVSFPSIIGKFRFKKEFIRGKVESKMFSLALYQDAKGKKAFAKMWKGRFKNFDYYGLANEIEVIKVLSDILKRKDNKLPSKFNNIRIPEYFGSYETNKSLILLTQYIEGETIDNIEKKKAMDICFNMFDFLRYLGERMTKKDKKNINTRTVKTILLIYPLFLFKTMLKHPSLTHLLFKGFTKSLMLSAKSINKKDRIVFGHRDLHLKNILINKKDEVFLLDLQYCMFSSDIYDLLFGLRVHFNDEYIRNRYTQEINSRFSDTDLKWVNTLMIISATHAISGYNLPQEVISSGVNFLKYSVNMNPAEKLLIVNE